MPSVSVVMCAYNAAEFIAPAIQSILDQALTDFELLIVDDASTDTTRDVIHTFKDPRIRLFYHEKNRGSGAARNTALREAKGEYIALMDADDISLPGRLKAQKEYLDNHKEVGVVGSNSFKLKGRKLEFWYRPHGTSDLEVGMPIRMCYTNPTLMLRHDIIRKYGICYPEDFKYGEAEDYHFLLQLLLHTKPASLMWPHLVYRIRSNSQYHGNMKISMASAAVCIKKFSFPDNPVIDAGTGMRAHDAVDCIYGIKKLQSIEGFDDFVKAVGKLVKVLEKVKGKRMPLYVRRFLLYQILVAARSDKVMKVPKPHVIRKLLRYAPRLLTAYFEREYMGMFVALIFEVFYRPPIRRRLEAYGAFEASSK